MNPLRKRFAVLCGALLLCGGCVSHTVRPPRPYATADVRDAFEIDVRISDYVAAYYGAGDSHNAAEGDPAGAGAPRIPASHAEIRQMIVSQTMILIDLNYQDFVENFSTFKKRGDTAAEIGIVSANAVAALISPLGTSQAVSAGAGVLSASQASFNKNYFYENTVPVLVASMEAQRQKIREEIIRNAVLPVETYPLEAALSDLSRYYAAGTFEGALELIAEQAAEVSSEASEMAARRYRVAFERIGAQAERAAEVRAAITDAESHAEFVGELGRLLDEAGGGPGTAIALAGVLHSMREEGRMSAEVYDSIVTDIDEIDRDRLLEVVGVYSPRNEYIVASLISLLEKRASGGGDPQ